MRSIMVPLDGSSFSERALPFAMRLCAPGGPDLILTRAVWEPSQMFVTNASAQRIAAARQEVAVQEATTQISQMATRLGENGVRVVNRVRAGNPSTVLLEDIRELGVDLIVIATHNRAEPARAFFGSVADEVVRDAGVPILVVPPTVVDPWSDPGTARVLVALDGSEFAEGVLVHAVELANLLQAEVVLLGVAQPGDTAEAQRMKRNLEGAAQRVAQPKGGIRVRIEVGDAAEMILIVAREEQALAIAMATHGRTGLGRLLMGSVTTAVLRAAPVPLLIYRDPSHSKPPE